MKRLEFLNEVWYNIHVRVLRMIKISMKTCYNRPQKPMRGYAPNF